MQMKYIRLLTFSVLSASAFLACGTSGGQGSTGTTGSGAGGAGTTAGGLGGSAGGGGDGRPIFDGDGGTVVDASMCKHLNIGIFGKQGANASSNFQHWLEMSGTSVQRIQTTPAEPLTGETVKPFDVIILDWLTRDYTASEAAVLSAFVSAGGGVASMTGYNNTTDDWRANSLLAPLGVAYSGPLLSQTVTSFAMHPITAGLTSVTFAGGYAVSDLGGAASDKTPIAFLSQQGAKLTVGYAIQMGAGHAFVWGDEWIEFDSEWSTLPQIKQLWVQVFAWIAPTNTCELKPPA
jgi:hypothetical protein